ncbi:MAG: hypothetical protein FWC26_07160 [Fibromonadales bacterium]|nr:hypothetical protein [Fibromonadales bacterium]
MKYNPDKHHRHSIRLRNYNYANAGAYFVTVCLNQRIPKIRRRNAGQQFVAQGQLYIAQGQPRRVAPTVMQMGFDFPTFGVIENGVMILNDSGKMIQQIWNEISQYYANAKFKEFVVMPDHIHGIITINNQNSTNNVGATLRGCPLYNDIFPICHDIHPDANAIHPDATVSLPQMIYCFKTRTTNQYIDGVKTLNWMPFNKRLWQRNYYEYIILNEKEYVKIAQYIRNNPGLWEKNTAKIRYFNFF